MNQSGSGDRFLDLDGMRGVLAPVIVAHHLGLNTALAQWGPSGFRGGAWPLCVDLFFILSGFVLSHSLARRPRKVPTLLRERAFRLLPLHLLVLALTAPVLASAQTSPRIWFDNALAIASFTQSPQLNGPAWSLNLELYLPLGLLVFRSVRRSRATIVLGLALALALQTWTTHRLMQGNFQTVPRGVAGLALGYFVHAVRQRWGGRLPSFPRWSAPVGLLLYLGLLLLSGFWTPLALLVPPVGAGLVLVGASSRSLLSRKPFQWMGRISFALYIIHWPFIRVVESWLSLDGAVGAKLLFLLASCLLSGAAFRFVELPGIRLGRWVGVRLRG